MELGGGSGAGFQVRLDLPEITLQPANQWKINDFLHDLPI